MLNIQVQGKRRRGYHQEDVKHAGKEKKGRIPPSVKHTSGGKEKKGRIPPRRC